VGGVGSPFPTVGRLGGGVPFPRWEVARCWEGGMGLLGVACLLGVGALVGCLSWLGVM